MFCQLNQKDIITSCTLFCNTYFISSCENHSHSTQIHVAGVDFQIKTMKYQGSTIILQLWDTAGQERFRSMTKAYFRKADGVIVMYDVTSERTFTSIRNWMTSVQVTYSCFCVFKKILLLFGYPRLCHGYQNKWEGFKNL